MSDAPTSTPTENQNEPVDTPSDTPAEAPASAGTPTEAAPAPEASAEEPTAKPAKKAAAKKAPAKKTAAKKTAAKKTAAKKTAASESGDAAEGKAPAKKAAAKKTAAKKAPAKKTAAKKTAAKANAKATPPPADPDQLTLPTEDEPVVEVPEAVAAAESSDTTETIPTPENAVEAADEVTDEATDETAMADAPSKSDGASEEQAAPEKTQDADGSEDAEDAEDSEDAEDEDEESGDGTSTAPRRRRRRGGRRRRKPAGAPGADGESDDAEGGAADGAATEGDTTDGTDATDAAADDADESDDNGDNAEGGQGGQGGSSSSRRRRRRRRAGEGGGDEGSDDPENTVTRVRKPRSPEDEITAVSGSTRLEAKKQRRREGREAGRRRAPIVSEAEFLARRESVERVMAVRQRKDLTQIAVLEDKVLVEHYVARESQTSLIGNVYLGRVQNVLPSMEAAFIDIGKGRNAVLYAGEVNWSALGHKDGQPRKIESVLQSGQTVLVQVTKDPIGHKGARLTSQVSLAGRFLVYVPDGTTSGISRKLPDTERTRLKTLLKEIVPDTAGVIVRTAAEGASEEELTRDVERLKARWEDIESKVAKGNAPQLLYGEPDLTLKVVRDLFTEDFAKLVVQGDQAWATVKEYVDQVAPDLVERLEHHQPGDGGVDLFAQHRIDEQIAKGLDRKVWLPSGGSLIIDRTEAMTVVDVNTGKFTGSGGNLEETVTKNNLEAAEEIVRQLRLRDIGGIIVVDFIDMVLESNRDLVLRRLVECLGRDRTRHQVAEVTSLGLVQMTRKRIGTGLLEAFSENCSHCQGRGVLVHELPVEPKRGATTVPGEEEPRRGRRSRKGRGGQGQDGQGAPEAQDAAAKPVPSPKDIAAMAKPAADEPTDTEPTDTGASEPAEQPVDAVADTAPAPAAEEPAVEEPAAEEPAVEAPAEEPAAEEAPAAPVTTVVTRTRRAATTPTTPAPEPVVVEVAAEAPAAVDDTSDEAPAAPVTTVVTRTRQRSASRTRPATPPAVDTQGGAEGDAPAAASSEPADQPADQHADQHADHPVEHVPIKKKGGARKR